MQLRHRGDTIVEVLFAITIMAVVISGAYAISNRAITSNRLNNERTTALKLAESQLERLREATSNPTLFNSLATSESTTAQYCLAATDTGDALVLVSPTSKCVVDNRYTITLKYNPATTQDAGDEFFTSQVEWDNEANSTNPKNVQLVYRVKIDSPWLALLGQSSLTEAKNLAYSLIPSNYTSTSWAALAAALALDELTQSQITAKALAISDAITKLVIASDMSSYNAALAAVKAADYTPASWAAYQLVVNANIVTNQNTQAQVNTATQNIKNAQANLAITTNNCSNSGEVSYSGIYKVHTFKTPGNATFVNNCNLTNVEVLLVGGGGSSADTLCVPSDWGGGAGGGYVTGTTTLSKQTYNFTVGAGGSGGGGGNNGAATTFNGYTASGGGKGWCNSGGSISASSGTGMTVNGQFWGGGWTGTGPNGGGGAGNKGNGICGGDYYGGCPASGGAGLVSAITGTNVTYGVGGAGGWNVGGTSGVNNTGNGGGGGHSASGGHGILVIRYNSTQTPYTPPPTIVGSGVGQYTITNYNTSYTYTLGASGGTTSRSGNVVYCNGEYAICTITGGDPSKTVSYQRYRYSSHSEPIYGWGHTGWGYDWGCSCGGKCGNWPNGDPFCQYPTFSDGAILGYYPVRDATPAGWTDSGGDWYRIY